MSLAEHLRSLPAADLAALLRRRADVLVEPAPRDLAELSDRLTGVDSLSLTLGTLDGDEVGIAPAELWDRFLRSRCLLRDDQRDVAVAGIEVVGPAR